MLAIAKRAYFQTAELKAGRWTGGDNVYLHGKVLGIVGTGHIGARMVRLAQAIGMQVLAWTFNPSPDRAAELGVRFVALDDLLKQADVVSLHVKLTDRTPGPDRGARARAHEAGRAPREHRSRRRRRHSGPGRSPALASPRRCRTRCVRHRAAAGQIIRSLRASKSF